MDSNTLGGIDGLKQCYRTLDVEFGASPRAIKRQYRRLAKQWHPDKHQQGSSEQASASAQMQRINEAYRRIQHAPLRYYVGRKPTVGNTSVKRYARVTKPLYTYDELLNYAESNARREKYLRFIAGLMLGGFGTSYHAYELGLSTPAYLLLVLATGVTFGLIWAHSWR